MRLGDDATSSSLLLDRTDDLALPGKPSIAVLAFTNMSGDLDQGYFSDGIADDIITELSRSHSLFVIARNSSFTYKGRAVDVKQAARELGVRYVVEGSVRRSGSRIRVTAQLIDAETANHIWAERYDRALDDVFAVQDEIAVAVTTAILPAVRSPPPETSPAFAPKGQEHSKRFFLVLLSLFLAFSPAELSGHIPFPPESRLANLPDPHKPPFFREAHAPQA